MQALCVSGRAVWSGQHHLPHHEERVAASDSAPRATATPHTSNGHERSRAFSWRFPKDWKSLHIFTKLCYLYQQRLLSCFHS